jgi:hypothetical protein
MLCHWILSLARWYDQTQPSTTSLSSLTSTSNVLSPLADELQLLVGRACAYHARVKADIRFHRIFEDSYILIRGGISHMLACDEKRNKKVISDGVWVLDSQLCWQPGRNKWTSLDTAHAEGEKTQSLFNLGAQASVDFLHGLFKEEKIVYARYSLNMRNIEPVVAFVPELQHLLLLIKRSDEETVLRQEAKGRYGTDYPIPEHEMRFSNIANAYHKLRQCGRDLETWSFHNDFSKERGKTKHFPRTENSLSSILERCDDALEKLYRERVMIPPPVLVQTEMEKPISNRERTGRREKKKKK